MSPQFSSLVEKLKEIFQIDKPELDFGIYRILRARRTQIEDFLNNRLAAKVQTTLAGNAAAEEIALKNALEEAIENARQLGIDDPTVLPKVRELKEKLAACSGSLQAENEVYSHLLTFFSRYYDKGDFISQRRYKGDTYAIPYSGEEVKLHWANADQYYVKSSESFSNYDFTLPDGGKVHFRLVSAELAKDNIKDNEAVRCFVLWDPAEAEGEEPGTYPPSCIEEKDYELYIYFQYRRFKKGKNLQAKVSDNTVAQLKNLLDGRWDILQRYNIWAPAPTEKYKERTIFRKYLDAYTAKNTSDYFIHKDLQGFLSRELDFYIKNEMMHLDDIQHASSFAQIEKNLRTIQAVRAIAGELIDFMAQIENFQKKLWLKKKFVVQCDYCLTMDLVPQELHAEVLVNERQLEEWRKMNTTDASRITDARMVDTRFFDESFKSRLLEAIENIDERCDGVLIHSDNWQALRFLKNSKSNSIKCVYIDPPYNTNASEIIYKNGYKHSSWISLMHDRLLESKSLMSDDAIIEVAIDDYELRYINLVLDDIFEASNFISNIAILTNPKGRDQDYVAQAHDYTLMYAKNKKHVKTYCFTLTESEKNKKYKKKLNGLNVRELPLKRTGSEKYREDRPYMYFPFFFNPQNSDFCIINKDDYLRIYDSKEARFNDEYLSFVIKRYEQLGYVTILPISQRGELLRWRWGYESCVEGIKKGLLTCKSSSNGKYSVYQYDSEDELVKPKSFWFGEEFDASSKGTNMLSHILPSNQFDFPKSLYTVENNLIIGSQSVDTVLDYFGGSGTTAHAVINLNRKDGGNRKYILVEMGDHFNAVLMPRIKKVVYSPDWKDGKPVTADKGISHCFKYMSLESYEDTLNNIELQEAKGGDMYDSMMQEQYLLKYMLDIESRGSIINTDSFLKPFDYCLKIAVDSSGASESRKVDLVETFNYLLGLRVESQERHIDKGYILVEGKMKNGAAVLIVWRDCDKIGSAELNALLEKKGIRPGDREFATIYVNGDHSIANKKLGGEDDTPELKVRSIEEEFLTRMFEGE